MTNQTHDAQYTEDDNCPWMIEFRQNYIDGLSVEKRGLDATPMVMKKYDIGLNEVMTFSSYQKRNSAISVFHFHPEFPFEFAFAASQLRFVWLAFFCERDRNRYSWQSLKSTRRIAKHPAIHLY